MNRRRYLKAAVPTEEYSKICTRADAEGLTVAGYIRVALARDVERQATLDVLNELRASLPPSDGSGPPSTLERRFDMIDPTMQEVLQLVRLMATTSNPQAAARVTAGINQQYPNR